MDLSDKLVSDFKRKQDMDTKNSKLFVTLF